jgi:hypothetical protein
MASGPPWLVSGFRFRARLGFSIPSTFSGPRGVTPAFGYSAPHSSARGTSTLLINALLSAHYGHLRPCAPHRYSDPCGDGRLDFSLHIGTTGSRVPYRSPSQGHATFMPDAGWTVSRSLPTFARGIEVQIPVSTPIVYVTTPRQWFTHVRLLETYLTELLPPFPQRSPPGLFTPAACGGLKPAPAGRLRRVILHLR